VHSRKGPGGGYMLARVPSEIKIGRVIRVIDGRLAPIACASRTAFQPCRDCRDVKACAVRRMMSTVRDAISDVLDRVTLADLHALNGRGRTAARRPGQKRRGAGRRNKIAAIKLAASLRA
ncbi:MAG: Rrf2 family transcriptional regulator, partial [Xanthobacteraceae bacterium]